MDPARRRVSRGCERLCVAPGERAHATRSHSFRMPAPCARARLTSRSTASSRSGCHRHRSHRGAVPESSGLWPGDTGSVSLGGRLHGGQARVPRDGHLREPIEGDAVAAKRGRRPIPELPPPSLEDARLNWNLRVQSRDKGSTRSADEIGTRPSLSACQEPRLATARGSLPFGRTRRSARRATRSLRPRLRSLVRFSRGTHRGTYRMRFPGTPATGDPHNHADLALTQGLRWARLD